MVTYKQLNNGMRKKRGVFVWSKSLKKAPQLRGRIIRFYTTTPRKPNSAKRKVAKIILSNKKNIVAKLVGAGNAPQKFATVLVRGGGYKDTPAVNYSMIRGALECLPLFYKNRKRSIFGVTRK